MGWVILLALLIPAKAEEMPLDYFLENRTERCWVLDRSSNKQVVSVAASGFGMAAWAIAAEEGKISRDDAISWINKCIDETEKANEKNHGWYYHFTDLNGNPVFDKEVSSVDTALFLLGARWAAQHLGDPQLIAKVEKIIAKVDKSFMITRFGKNTTNSYFCHGFIWKDDQPDFLECDWGDEYTEGVLLYRLFEIPYAPKRMPETLPLFVYYYPLCFYRDQNMIDLLGRAIDRQIKDHGVVGYTACDGPQGYGVMQPDVISPLAVASCEPFYEEKLKSVWIKMPVAKTTPSMQVKTGWVSSDRIGIDDGAYLLTHYHFHR